MAAVAMALLAMVLLTMPAAVTTAILNYDHTTLTLTEDAVLTMAAVTMAILVVLTMTNRGRSAYYGCRS